MINLLIEPDVRWAVWDQRRRKNTVVAVYTHGVIVRHPVFGDNVKLWNGDVVMMNADPADVSKWHGA